MFKWIKKLFSTSQEDIRSQEQLEELRRTFKQKFIHFQRLLAANNQALKLMTEIEEMLEQETLPSMPFVRSRSTRIATNVFQIIRHLSAIAPDKYTDLGDAFKGIQSELTALLAHETDISEDALVIDLKDARANMAGQVGGKMAALGEMGKIPDVRIPKGFVITAAGYRAFVEQSGIRDEINRIIQSLEAEKVDREHKISTRIQELIEHAALPHDLEEAVFQSYEQLTNGNDVTPLVAMRSSAVGEDSKTMSFAGQYRSVLNVKKEKLLDAYREVVASKYCEQAMSYRLHYGVGDDEVAMCAGCMPMAAAERGGVIYTRDPLDENNDTISIYAARGLPQAVVDGSAEADTYLVAREGPGRGFSILSKRLRKDDMTKDEILSLAALAMSVEDYFGTPQDIEWVMGFKEIILLQSRPLTRRLSVADSGKTKPKVDARTVVEGGITASRGAATGRVFIAKGVKGATDFGNGDVLVITQPLPYWATVLEKASAVVAEQGSAACHLANVAREFGVPMLLGLTDATKHLKDRDVVTVDADGARIFAGEVTGLESNRSNPAEVIIDNPVRQSLRRVSKLILPLRLLDPSAPEFKPDNCKTFHDITRFCHEKAVVEMFRFGKEHSFPQRASRRLYKDKATQFWIVDLDDGLIPGADDPYFIRFEEIVSIPMLAIWRGMEAFAWEGPPKPDAHGFFQVLAASAMDAHLDTTVPSRYTTGSHFMISKNFCSLQTRFGFHFASVEALIGDRPLENYVRFQFSGGGAGQARKARRARLVSDVLEEYGYFTDCKKDLVDANIGGYEKAVMEEAVEVIGYLLVHTRQLDMIMTDAASANKYKAKMLGEIAEMRQKKK